MLRQYKKRKTFRNPFPILKTIGYGYASNGQIKAVVITKLLVFSRTDITSSKHRSLAQHETNAGHYRPHKIEMNSPKTIDCLCIWPNLKTISGIKVWNTVLILDFIFLVYETVLCFLISKPKLKENLSAPLDISQGIFTSGKTGNKRKARTYQV